MDMPPTTSIDVAQNAELLRALSDVTRQKILQLLAREELNVSELVEILHQPQSTISRHLRVLREAALIRDRRHGTSTLYSAIAAPDHAEIAQDDVQGFMVRWLARQPLPDSIEQRFQQILLTRGGGSTGFFNRLGRRWDELRIEAFGEVFSLEAFLSLLPREWVVADVGSGTGYLLPYLAANFARVIAVDPAESMLECGRQRIVESGAKNVDFHRGELSKLPIPSGGVDLAMSFLVLHHVKDPGPALAEFRRVLRRGGQFLIVEQEAHENQEFYQRMQDVWWGFVPTELEKLLTEIGFRDVRFQTLQTAAAQTGRIESPPLFAITGKK